jgi:hypothetical protein
MWKQASRKSMREVVVPPIIVPDEVFGSALDGLLIRPSELSPFMDSGNLRLLTSATLAERGEIFEKSFLAALRARYQLLVWERAAAKAMDPSDPKTMNPTDVPLVDVLKGAISLAARKHLKAITVNLSEGQGGNVATYQEAAAAVAAGKKQLWWTATKRRRAHHDAYLTASRGGTSFPMAVQMRLGQAKTADQLEPQLLQSHQSGPAIDLPLLSVNNGTHGWKSDSKKVAVDASMMMAVHWLEVLK